MYSGSIAPPLPAISPGYTQSLPDLGDESQSLITPKEEYKLGESVVRQIRSSGAYLDDPEVNDYLNDLGHRLVAARPDSNWEFEFFAMGDPSVNAFALPGGFVGVNMGLILLTQSESELAAVLAHEISHVTQRHFTRSIAGQQRSMLYTLAALAVAIAASRASSPSAGQAAAFLAPKPVGFIYGVTNFFLEPFKGLLPAMVNGRSVLEPAVLIAIVVYLLVGFLLAKIIEITLKRSVTVAHRSRTRDFRPHSD